MSRTPEARLLEMIKKGAAGPRTSWKLGFPQALKVSFRPDVIALNRVLLGALAALSLFWAGRPLLGFGRTVVGWKDLSSLSQAETRKEGGEDRVRLKDLTRRPLFRPLVAAPPPPPAPVRMEAPPTPRIPLSQRASHLNLVGILPGPPLQAVIEDKNQGNTFYLSAGQSIGGIVVKAVSAGGVTLSADDETLDLSL